MAENQNIPSGDGKPQNGAQAQQPKEFNFYGLMSNGADFRTLAQTEGAYNATMILEPKEEVFADLLQKNPNLADTPEGVQYMENLYQDLINTKLEYDKYKENVGDAYAGIDPQYIGTGITRELPTNFDMGGRSEPIITGQQLAYLRGTIVDIEGRTVPMDHKRPDHYLVLKNDKDYPYFQEVSSKDYINGMEMLSAFGPTEVTSDNIFSSLGRGAVAGVALMPKGVGSLVESVGDIFGDANDDNKWTDLVGHKLMNFGNYYTGQNLDEAQDPFGNWSAFLWSFGNGITQLSSMILTSYATGMTASALGIAKAAQLGEAAGLLLGAVEGGSGLYEEAKDLGLSEEDAARMFFKASAGTLMSEMVIGANVIQRGYGRQARQMMRETFAKSLDGRDIAKIGANELDAIKKTFWQKYYVGLREFADKNMGTRIGVGAIEEGIEELIEGGLHYATQNWENSILYNAADEMDRSYRGVKFERLDQAYRNRMGRKDDRGTTIPIFGPGIEHVMTMPDGQIIGLTAGEYEAIQKDLVRARGILDGSLKTYDPTFNTSEGAMAAITTAATLGMGGATNTMGVRNKRVQQFNEAQQALNEIKNRNAQKSFDKGLTKWVQKESGYLRGQNSQGQAVSDPTQSVAQDMANAVRARINAYKQFITRNGYDNTDVLNAIGGEEAMKESMIEMSQIADIRNAIDQAENTEEIEYDGKTYNQEDLEKKIAKLDESIKFKTEITDFGTSEYMRKKVFQYNMFADMMQHSKATEGEWANKMQAIMTAAAFYNNANDAIGLVNFDEAVSSGKVNLGSMFGEKFTEAFDQSTLQEVAGVSPGDLMDEGGLEKFENMVSQSLDIINDLDAQIEEIRTFEGKNEAGGVFAYESDNYQKALKSIESSINDVLAMADILFENGDLSKFNFREEGKSVSQATRDKFGAISAFSTQIDNELSNLKNYRRDKKAAADQTKPYEERVANAIYFDAVQKLKDIRKAYKENPSILTEEANANVIETAFNNLAAVRLYLDNKRGANRTDENYPVVDREIDGTNYRTTYSDQVESIERNYNGVTISNKGDILTDGQINKIGKYIDEAVNGTQEGDLTLEQMYEKTSRESASLKKRDQRRRILHIHNQAAIISKLPPTELIDDKTRNAMLTLYEEAKVARMNALMENKWEEDDIISMEKTLNNLKTDIHKALDNKDGEMFIKKQVVDLGINFKHHTGETYDYNNNKDGQSISEFDFDVGQLEYGKHKLVFNMSEPFSLYQKAVELSEKENLPEVKKVARVVAHKAVDRHIQLFNELLNLDNNKFYDQLHSVFETSNYDDGDRVISIQQENAIKQVMMGINASRDLIVLRAANEDVTNSNKVPEFKRELKAMGYNSEEVKELTALDGPLFTRTFKLHKNAFLVQGTGGAGKTTFVLSTIAKMIDNNVADKNSDHTFIHVGPNMQNVEAQKRNIGTLKNVKNDKGYTIKDFADALDNDRVTVDDNTVIFLDEASLVFIEQNNAIQNHLEKGALIALGDPQQPKYNIGGDPDVSAGIILDHLSYRTPMIDEVHRADVKQISDLQNSVSRSMTTMYDNTVQLPADLGYNGDMTKGVYVYSDKSQKDFEKMYVDHVDRFGKTDRVIIFATESDAEQFKKRNTNIPPENVSFIQPNDPLNANTSAQGLEFKYVYVAMKAPSDMHNLRIFKTAVGRAKKFVSVMGDPNKSSKRDNIIDISVTSSEGAKSNEKNERELFQLQKSRIETMGSQNQEPITTPRETISRPEKIGKSAAQTAKTGPFYVLHEKVTKKGEELNRVNPDQFVNELQELRDLKNEYDKVYGQQRAAITRRVKAIEKLFDSVEVVEDVVENTPEEEVDLTFSEDTEADLIEENIVSAPNTLKFSSAVMVADEATVSMVEKHGIEKHYNNILKQRFYNEDTTIKLVFHKEIDLYNLNNGEIETNYNVILVERGGETVGVLYQPLMSPAEETAYKNELYRKSKHQLGVQDYDPNNVQYEKESAKGASVMALSALYHHALGRASGSTNQDAILNYWPSATLIVNDKDTRDTFTFAEFYDVIVQHQFGDDTELNMQYNFKEENDFTFFFERIVSNGGAFKGVNNTSVTEMSDDIIVDQVKRDGYVNDIVYAKRIDDPNFGWVPIEIKGQRINEINEAEAEKVSIKNTEELKELRKAAREAESRKGTKADQSAKMKYFNEKLNSSFMAHAINYNRSLFLDRNGNIIRDYEDVLKKRPNGYIDVKSSGGTTTIVDNLKDVYNKLVDNGAFFPTIKVKVLGIEQGNAVRVNGAILRNAKTNAVRFNTRASHIDDMNTSGSNNENSGNHRNPLDWLAATKETRTEDMVPLADQMYYLEAVFGKQFLMNDLEFSSSLLVNGKPAYGAVGNMRMFIETVNDLTQRGVGRHEAVHFALKHFVSPESYKKITDDARIQMRLKGVKGPISDNMAEEFIAEVNEGIREARSKSLVSRFVNWVRGVINYITGNRDTVNEFLNKLNRGGYKNEPVRYNNSEQVSLMERGRSQNDPAVDKLLEEVFQFDFAIGAMNRQQMAREVGGDANLVSVMELVTQIIKNNDPSRTPIKWNDISSFDQYYDVITEGLNMVAAQNDLIKGQKDVTYAKNKTQRLVHLSKKIADNTLFKESLMAVMLPTINFNENTVESSSNEVMRDDFNAKSLEQKTSAILNNELNSIHFKRVKVVNKSIKLVPGTPQNASGSKLKAVLIEVFKDYGTNGDNGVDPVTRAFKIMHDYIKSSKSDGTNENANMLASFLLDLGYLRINKNGSLVTGLQQGITDDTLLKPYHYYKFQNAILKQLGYNDNSILMDEISTEGTLANKVKNKSAYASDILNAFASLYVSAQVADYVSVEHKRDEDGSWFQSKKRNNTNVEEQKRIFNSALVSRFFAEEGLRNNAETLVLPANKTDKKPSRTLSVEGNSISIHYNKGKKVEAIRYNENKGTFEWVGGKDQKLLNDLFRAMGIYVTSSTRNAILGINYSSKIGIDQIADGFGAIAYTLRSYFEQDTNNHYKNAVEKFANKHRLDPIRMSELLDPEDTIEDANIHIESFYDYTSALATVETEMNIINARGYTYTPEGKAVNQAMLGSHLSRMFTSSGTGQEALMNFYSDALKNTNNFNNPFTVDGTVIEPILNGKINVVKLHYTSGIEDKFTPHDIKHLTEADMINHMVYGHWLTSVLRNNQEQVLRLSTTTMSDSGFFPVFDVTFGKDVSSRLFDVTKVDGNIKKVTMNNEVLANMFDDKFKVYFKKAAISINKWTGIDVYTGETTGAGIVSNVTDIGKYSTPVERAEYLINAINEHLSGVNKMSASNTNLHKLSKAGMVRNVDYTVEKAGERYYIRIGKNTEMSYETEANIYATESPFTLQNYKGWMKLKDNDQKADYIDVIMDDRLRLHTNMIKESANLQPRSVDISGWNNRMSKMLEKPVKIIPNVQKSVEYNPLHRAFVYSYFLFNDSLVNTVMGNEFQSEDARKLAKYAKTMVGQGYVANTDDLVTPVFTVGPTFNVARMVDQSAVSSHYKEMLGIKDEYMFTDGTMLTHRLFTHFLNKAYGGNASYMNQNDNTMKTIATGIDPNTGLGQYKKSANVTLNDDFYAHNPELYNSLTKLMLQGNHSKAEFPQIEGVETNLWNKYQEYVEDNTPTEAMSMLAEYVENVRIVHGVDLLQGTIARIEFVSTAKMHSPNVNYMSWDKFIKGDDIRIDTQRTQDELFVLNANQSITERRVTDLSQIKLISNINSRNGATISNIDSFITEKLFMNIKDEFGVNDLDKFSEAFRGLGSDIVDKIKGASSLNDLLNIPELSINIPTVMNKLWPTFMKRLQNAVDFKVPGLKMVQAAGDMFIKYYDIETENGTIRATMEDIERGLFKITDKTTSSPLKHTRIDQENEGIIPAEVAMPFVYAEEFGISRQNRHTLNEILNFVVGGKNINLRAYLKNELGNEYYTNKEAVKTELSKFINDNFNKFDDKSFFKNLGTIQFEDAKALTKYYSAFLDTLDVFAARIPSTSKGLAFAGEVTSFTYDSGTTVYVSSEKILFDDSDYDIDQLTVLFRGITTSGNSPVAPSVTNNRFQDQSIGALMNKKFDLLYNDWVDYKQKDHIFIRLNVNDAVERAETKQKNEVLLNNDFSTNIKNFIASHTGKQMVSVFANMIHVYSKLNQLTESQRKQFLSEDMQFNNEGTFQVEDKVHYIIDTLGELLQISVDNPKLMILDMLNINTESGSFIAALAMSGKSKNEIYDMLASNKVQDIFRKAHNGRSIGSTAFDQFDYVEKIIRKYETKDDAVYDAMRKNRVDRLARMMTKYQEQKEAGHKLIQLYDDGSNGTIKTEEITDFLENKRGFDKITKLISGSDTAFDEFLDNFVTDLVEREVITMTDDKYVHKGREYNEAEIKEIVRKDYVFNSRTFDKYAENALVDIDDKIEATRQELSELTDENSDSYIEKIRKDTETNLSEYREIYNMMIVGESIRRVVPILRLNKNIPSSQYELYDFIERTEFATGTTLENLVNKKEESNYEWRDKGNHLLKESVFQQWSNTSQAEINNYVNQLLDGLIDSGVADKISIRTTGESGFDQAIANAFANKGINVTVYYEKGKRFTNEAKMNVYDSSGTTRSSDRYKGLRPKNNFNEVETDDKSLLSLWHTITKKDGLSRRERDIDAQFVFNPFNQGLYAKVHAIHGKNSIHASSGVADPTEEAIERVVGDITARVEEIEKSKSTLGRDGKIEIAITGPNISLFRSQRQSPYNAWMTRENAIRSKFKNLPDMLRSFRNIKTYLTMIKYANDNMRHFVWNGNAMDHIENQYTDMQKKSRLSNGEYVALRNQLQNAYVDEFFTRTSDEDFTSIDLTRFNGESVQGAYGVNITNSAAENINLNNYTQSLYFTFEFPQYIMAVKENGMAKDPDGSINKFLDSLIIDNGSLIVRDHNTLTDAELSVISESFKLLDDKTKKLFFAYNLLRSGFNAGGYFSLTNFIGNFMAKELGTFIDSVSEDPSFILNVRSNFVGNAVINDSNLYRYFTKRANDTYVPPEISMVYKKIDSGIFGRNRQTTVPGRYLRTVDGRAKYEQMYNQVSGYMKRLPTRFVTNSNEETTRFSDVGNLREWMDDHATTIRYAYKHTFRGLIVHKKKAEVPANLIRINTEYAQFRKTFNSITITKTSQKEYEETAKSKVASEPVASRDIGKRRAMSANTLEELVKNTSFSRGAVIVNNKTTKYPGLKGYIENGTIHYNSDLVTMDTYFHEMAHVYLWDGAGYEVIGIAENMINNNDPLAVRIAHNYPALDKKALVYEVAATLMGFNSESKIDALLSGKKPSVRQRILKAIRNAWNDIISYINMLFGTDIKIDPNDTIGRVVDKMIKNVRSGKFDPTKNDISALQNKYNSYLAASKPITDIQDMADAMLLKDSKLTVDEYVMERHANNLWNRIKRRKNKKLYADGVTYNFEPYVTNNDKEGAIRVMVEKYLPKLYKDGAKVSKNVFRWLRNTADGGKADVHTVSSYFKLGGKENDTKFKETLVKFSENIGWNSNSVSYTPTQFTKKYPTLKDSIPPGVENDTRIIVHRSVMTSSGDVTSMDISLVKVFPSKVNFGNVGLRGGLISSNYMSDVEGSALGVNMKATLANVEKLKMAMTVMQMKQIAGDRVNIRAIGLSEMDDVSGSITYTQVNLIQALKNLQALSGNEEFKESLSPQLRGLITSPDVFRYEKYSPDYFEVLLSMFSDSNYKRANDPSIKGIVSQLSDVVSGRGNVKKLLESLRLYKHSLDRLMSSDITKHLVDENEYQTISNALFEFNTMIDVSEKNIKEPGIYRSFLMNQADQGNRIIQSFYNSMRNELGIISGLFAKEQQILSDETEKIMKMHNKKNPSQKIVERMVDASENYFDKFFIYEEIDGESVNTFRIHHDINDPLTKQAIGNGTLSQEEFEYSQFIAEKVEEYMINLIRAKFKYSFAVFKDGSFNEKKLESMTMKYYNDHWEKGRIPLLRKGTSTYLKEGKVLQAMRKFSYQTSNPEQVFQDVLVDDHTTLDESVNSVFLNQVGGEGTSAFGDDKRLANIGLEDVDGNIIVKDIKNNTIYTKNLFNIAKYMAMDSISKPILEDRLLPAYREAKIAADTVKMFSDTDKGRVAKHLRVMFEKNVLGRHQKHFKDSKLSDNIEGFGRMMIRITTFNGVALSIPVAVTSLTANTFESIMNSVAVNISGANPYDLFNFKNWASAVKEYTVNFKKVRKIMEYYQVIESDRWDYLVNPRYDVTFRSPWHSNAAHFMNRWTDLSMRAMAAVAQMKHDGTWDAHSLNEKGEVVYNASKDTRINNYQSDKKQAELRNWLVESLSQDERVMDQQKDKLAPVRAYDVQDQRRLEHVGSQFVVGVYNKEASINGDSYFFANLVLQFKKFMTTKIGERLGSKIEAFEGGKKVIREDEEGNFVRAWQTYEKEGSWVTASKILLKSTPFVANVLSKYEWVNQTRSIWQWQNMSELEKYNLVRASLDLLFIATAYFAYTGLSSLAESEDEDNWALRYRRIWRAMTEGMQTAILTSPGYMMSMFTALPVVNMAKSVFNVIMLREPEKNLSHVLPLGSTVKLGNDIINETKE